MKTCWRNVYKRGLRVSKSIIGTKVPNPDFIVTPRTPKKKSKKEKK